MRSNDAKRGSPLKEEVPSMEKMNVLVFGEIQGAYHHVLGGRGEWEMARSEPAEWEMALLRKLGMHHQSVRIILVPTGDCVSLLHLWQLVHRSQTWKKGLAVRQTHLVCAMPKAHLPLGVKSRNRKHFTKWFFSSSSCSSTVLLSSVFSLWACSQQQQPGKVTENDCSEEEPLDPRKKFTEYFCVGFLPSWSLCGGVTVAAVCN